MHIVTPWAPVKDKRKKVLPRADKNSADTKNHGRRAIKQFEAPVVNRNLIRSYDGRNDLWEGTDKHVCHYHRIFLLFSLLKYWSTTKVTCTIAVDGWCRRVWRHGVTGLSPRCVVFIQAAGSSEQCTGGLEWGQGSPRVRAETKCWRDWSWGRPEPDLARRVIMAIWPGTPRSIFNIQLFDTSMADPLYTLRTQFSIWFLQFANYRWLWLIQYCFCFASIERVKLYVFALV